MHLWCNFELRHLCAKCDGWGEPFTADHALSYKTGGLVHLRHDDVGTEFGYLTSQALKPSSVSYEPKMHSGRTTTIEQVDTTLAINAAADQHDRTEDNERRGGRLPVF